jgi:mRNA interferase MazF
VKPGDIVLAIVPQSDAIPKLRPALILKHIPPFGDFLICGISTQLRQFVPDLDEVISPEDTDFARSHLVERSLIRLGWLETITVRRITGVIGYIDENRLLRLKARLATFLRT